MKLQCRQIHVAACWSCPAGQDRDQGNVVFERIREACGSLCRCAASAPVCAWAGNVTFDAALRDSLAVCEVSKCPPRDVGTQQHVEPLRAGGLEGWPVAAERDQGEL